MTSAKVKSKKCEDRFSGLKWHKLEPFKVPHPMFTTSPSRGFSIYTKTISYWVLNRSSRGGTDRVVNEESRGVGRSHDSKRRKDLLRADPVDEGSTRMYPARREVLPTLPRPGPRWVHRDGDTWPEGGSFLCSSQLTEVKSVDDPPLKSV